MLQVIIHQSLLMNTYVVSTLFQTILRWASCYYLYEFVLSGKSLAEDLLGPLVHLNIGEIAKSAIQKGAPPASLHEKGACVPQLTSPEHSNLCGFWKLRLVKWYHSVLLCIFKVHRILSGIFSYIRWLVFCELLIHILKPIFLLGW